jgi:hypothetical protein
MSPFRRLLSCALGLAFILPGAYMLYSLLFLGSGGYIWMYASSGIGVFLGGYLIWTDGIAPLLGKQVD